MTVTLLRMIDPIDARLLNLSAGDNRTVSAKLRSHRISIQVLCNMNRFVSQEMLLQILAIRYTNAKSLNCVGLGGIAIFPTFSLVNHDCVPNTVQELSVENGEIFMNLIANRDIKKGEEITTSYLRTNLHQPERRLTLWRSWRFVCQCEKCSNFQENLPCPNCNSFCLNSETPNVPMTNWKCINCHQTYQESILI